MKITIAFFTFLSLLSISFWLSGNTNQVLNQEFSYEFLAENEIIEYNYSAALDESAYASKLDQIGINLHPGTEYTSESKSSPRSLRHCKSLVYRTLKSLPSKPVEQLDHLTLYFADNGRRGLGGSSTIILRCQNVTDEELVGVLVHEMGHIMDIGVMEGSLWAGKSEFMDGNDPVYKDDASLNFYRISWEDDETLKEDADELDFVSGYAMTDPFEDFAESYAYYVLHGDEFRALARYNTILNKKYNYLKYQVFDGEEYYNGNKDGMNVFDRHFDVTVLSYDLDEFFVV